MVTNDGPKNPILINWRIDDANEEDIVSAPLFPQGAPCLPPQHSQVVNQNGANEKLR